MLGLFSYVIKDRKRVFAVISYFLSLIKYIFKSELQKWIMKMISITYK